MTAKEENTRIRSNIFKIFSGTFVSRIFGFVREMVVAWFFGTSKTADAFSFALIFPNLFRQVLGEDMVERAFMPPFKTKYDRGEVEGSWKFLSVIFNWFFVALQVITAVMYFITPLIFIVLKYFNPDAAFDYDLSLKLIFILIPFMLFIGLAAFVGSLLNFFERNWIFGFAPIMLSVGVIAGIVWLKPLIGDYSIAAGYLLGAFLQFAVHLPFLMSKKFKNETGIKYSPAFTDGSNDYKVIKRESKIITLNALFNKSAEFFDRLIATWLITGSASSLFYSQRLFQLPFAIISLPITRGINPMLNRLKSTNDSEKFTELYEKGNRIYFKILVPVTVICIAASDEIVSVIYQRGAFDADSLKMTSQAFIMYSLGLIPISFAGYYMRVLSLVSKNIHSLKVSVISAGINIVLSYVLAVYTSLGHAGVALATSLAFYYNMIRLNSYIKEEMKDLLITGRTIFFSKGNIVSVLTGILLIFILRSAYISDINLFEGIFNILTLGAIKALTVTGVFAVLNRVYK
ncbi:MAG: murein biosynthesis integral membrane protein MurJ [Candidatus Delongbacteria bacterium]|nr:murein biosynthesis integral membrane protein MurJ [Candidatus Delongbacteria bacterium]